MVSIKRIKETDLEGVRNALSRVHTTQEKIHNDTKRIVDDVREKGFSALRAYTLRFDGVDLAEDDLRVSKKEIKEAYQKVDHAVVASLTRAADNIRAFHLREQMGSRFETDVYGNLTGQMVRPLRRVGCYVPGGTASYPSSVLMTAVPASVAGVRDIVMVCPPDATGRIDATSLVAADVAGVTEIYKMGGAQAVAALAYGAGPVARVDKIVGPGNAYVTMAKKICYGDVDIDMLAGPSEILVVADASARASFVAADLLSQAEHDPLSSAICLTDSEELADEIEEELNVQVEKLERKEIALGSLGAHGAIVVCDSLKSAVSLANDFAPEHLELCVDRPFEILHLVENAGAIFLGHHTPEAVGDYVAGPNHVLPTLGTARFYSPLNLHTYLKKMSLVSYSPEGLAAYAEDIVRLARKEGLEAHARSVTIRMDEKKCE